MAVFKCKMCGGALDIAAGASVIECEYCGTKQTLPRLDDDRRANLYDRANHFRRNNDFDKAMGIYEQILNEDSTDAEAYWSLVLCRYGIEYVKDPASGRRIPTVNRAQFTSIFDDNNYRSAIKYADTAQKALYEEEANAINEIQKGILAISQNEEPFDVFICYKENDAHGGRTHDSVLAQELYYQLKNEGFKVFFARITLEDKLGSAYEPYIFAALNSAKVMVVIGTNPEHFAAPWVKNEWSRYLGLVKQGQKKVLIPAYRDMDPYDLPDEFSHLQAQDMAKLGFMQDLVRGIKKIAKPEEPKSTVVKETVVKETVVNETAPANTSMLVKRIFVFLEDGDWNSANEYCEKVLDINVENAEAYLGKLMAELQIKTKDELKNCSKPFDNSNNYQKIMRYGDDDIKEFLAECSDVVNQRFTLAEEAKKRKEKALIISLSSAVSAIALILLTVFVFVPNILVLTGQYKTYIDLYQVTDFEVPEGVTSIGDGAFSGCTSIETAIIPTLAISYIPDNNLKTVIITSGESIGERAFSGCTSLTSVVIGDSVTSIGHWAFYNCTSLTSVVIGDSVTSIGRSAFCGCSSLTSIKYRGTQSQWNAISKGSYWIYNAGNYTITYNYTGK